MIIFALEYYQRWYFKEEKQNQNVCPGCYRDAPVLLSFLTLVVT